MIANIKIGKADPAIVAAAMAQGIILQKPGSAAGAPAGAGTPPGAGGAIITGPKGQAHDTTKVAQHILAGGYIPPRIVKALQESNFYLLPGQTPKNPTAPPKKDKKGNEQQKDKKQGAQDKKAGQSKPATPAVPAGKKAQRRDLGMDRLYQRDLAAMYERDLADQLYQRDLYDQGLYERDLYEPSLYERDLSNQGLFERDPEAMVTYDEIKGLAKAVGRDPQAGQAVYQALTMDPNVEQVTEKLVADWLTDADMAKREAEAYESYLEARDAEAEADAEADAEAYESYLEARDANPEADADAAEMEELYMIDY
jgi:hypothetical protein